MNQLKPPARKFHCSYWCCGKFTILHPCLQTTSAILNVCIEVHGYKKKYIHISLSLVPAQIVLTSMVSYGSSKTSCKRMFLSFQFLHLKHNEFPRKPWITFQKISVLQDNFIVRIHEPIFSFWIESIVGGHQMSFVLPKKFPLFG